MFYIRVLTMITCRCLLIRDVTLGALYIKRPGWVIQIVVSEGILSMLSTLFVWWTSNKIPDDFMNSMVLSQVFTLETIKYYSFCDSLLHTYYLLRTLAYYPMTLCGIIGPVWGNVWRRCIGDWAGNVCFGGEDVWKSLWHRK